MGGGQRDEQQRFGLDDALAAVAAGAVAEAQARNGDPGAHVGAAARRTPAALREPVCKVNDLWINVPNAA